MLERARARQILGLSYEEFDRLTPLETTLELMVAEAAAELSEKRHEYELKFLLAQIERLEHVADIHGAHIAVLLNNANFKEKIEFLDALINKPKTGAKTGRELNEKEQAAHMRILARARKAM